MAQVEQIALTPEREALRSANGVRVVTREEEGTGVRYLPGGVYGFTGAPATAELPLFGKPMYEAFEIQKLADGGLVFVGYVTADEKKVIEAGSEPVVVDLYPEPRDAANTLVTIPGERVDRRRPPTRDHGNSMKVDIGPR